MFYNQSFNIYKPYLFHAIFTEEINSIEELAMNSYPYCNCTAIIQLTDHFCKFQAVQF